MRDASIERFFETYAELYMASDVDAVAAMYEAPFLAVRESRTIHLGDREAVRQHLMGLMEAYRNAGAKRATIADLRVTPLDSASVIATVRWNALAEDGALLRDFTTSYQMLRQKSDGWRIISYTYHHD
jgi:ketosteroid isomerase-like protein